MQLRLIELRKKEKVSQEKMAELLGINVSSYGAKERGQQQFNMEEMFKIKNFFDLPMEQIFLPRDFIKNAVYKNIN